MLHLSATPTTSRAGRLTLKHWLIPRLDTDRIHQRPGVQVLEADCDRHHDALNVALSDPTRPAADFIICACGYRAALGNVSYQRDLRGEIHLEDGFPVLDEAFQTTLDGLYITGFSSTKDFGPFFGFVKGTSASATLIVRDVLTRTRARRSQPPRRDLSPPLNVP